MSLEVAHAQTDKTIRASLQLAGEPEAGKSLICGRQFLCKPRPGKLLQALLAGGPQEPAVPSAPLPAAPRSPHLLGTPVGHFPGHFPSSLELHAEHTAREARALGRQGFGSLLGGLGSSLGALPHPSRPAAPCRCPAWP